MKDEWIPTRDPHSRKEGRGTVPLRHSVRPLPWGKTRRTPSEDGPRNVCGWSGDECPWGQPR